MDVLVGSSLSLKQTKANEIDRCHINIQTDTDRPKNESTCHKRFFFLLSPHRFKTNVKHKTYVDWTDFFLFVLSIYVRLVLKRKEKRNDEYFTLWLIMLWQEIKIEVELEEKNDWWFRFFSSMLIIIVIIIIVISTRFTHLRSNEMIRLSSLSLLLFLIESVGN